MPGTSLRGRTIGRVALLVAAALSGCMLRHPAGWTRAVELRVDPAELHLCVGMAEFVRVQVEWAGPGDGPADQPPELTWESRTPRVVSVSPDGRIRALAPGRGSVRVRGGWPGAWNAAELRVVVHEGAPVPTGSPGEPRILTAPVQCRPGVVPDSTG